MKKAIKNPINPCPYHKKCGGCSLQNLTYSDQLRYKQVRLIKLLGVFGHVEEIIGMEEPFRYRNKAQFPVGYDKNGDIVFGFYSITYFICFTLLNFGSITFFV